MFSEPVASEMVCLISDEENRQILKEHFNHFYMILAEDAAFESKDGVHRCFSGMPLPFQNAMIGCPEDVNWDRYINEQLRYFNEAKTPFVWYLDEQSNPEFKNELFKHGFQDGGVFRGIIGVLDKPIPSPEVPAGCVLELVKGESSMDEFNDLVCATFNIQGVSKKMYQRAMWDATQNERHTMYHWVAKKDGKVVSALSTLIEGNMVSFWNGATLPEMRHQGLSTALRRLALRDAISRGCSRGASYLMAEGLAFGICSKLGYETKWRFNVFLSPVQPMPN